MKVLSATFVFIALSIATFSPLTTRAQTAGDVAKLVDSSAKTAPPVNLKPLPPTPKRFWRGAYQLGLAQVVPWSYGRFVADAPYSRVTGESIKYNLNPTHWAFDKDIFQTNQFGHPYQGSLYFSAFRTNGYSFWESVPAAFAGSYMWETFGENEAPSPNDFVNTSFGGVVLGEMSYRLSNKLVNNHTTGFKRQLTEVAGFLINPMNGLNRIIDGKWGKVDYKAANRDSSRISAEFDLGVRSFNANNSNFVKYGKFGLFGRVKLLYGNRYQDYETPFSNIYISAEMGKDDSSLVNNVNVYGSLIGWEIKSNQKLQHLAILSANYDYIRNEAFFYGAQSVKLNLFSEYNITKMFTINTAFAAGPVILAAVPDKYRYNGRTYNYASGVSLTGGGGINISDRIFASVDYRGGWLQTINGNKSHYFLHTVNSEFRYFTGKKLSLAFEPGYFILRGYYKDYPDIDQKYPFARFSARYSVNL
ncbi:DUF3943 domain-containing protein [Mucilaginibacter sp.]|uniref:DUF3943 domain-containing protein n=1 Tax=Mucilaginibacter sp. TaxID=1882438 RepID=UPI0035BBF187